jgi:transcription elongation factor Elf1
MLAPKLEPTMMSLWGNCLVCGGEMRIILIEPHPISDKVEKRTFECTRCGRSRIYTVDLS